jgi:hypothetical protein
MPKIALMTGVAGAILFAGPLLGGAALAQEASPPAPQQTPPTTQTPAASPSQVSLTPGQTVRGPDGELGKLEGIQVDAQGQQELTVRGADGQLRAVPLGGLQVNGSEVTVAWSLEQYQAAPAIAGAAPAPTSATPPTEGDAAAEPLTSTTAPTNPAAPSALSAPGAIAAPTETAPAPRTPGTRAMPATPPVENPAAPTTTPQPVDPAAPSTTTDPMDPGTATPPAGEDPDA